MKKRQSNNSKENPTWYKSKLTRRLAITGLIAAVYVVLTLSLYFLSYKEIQFRVAEILNLFAFINPVFAPGIILGCFISNLFSPIGPVMDCIFGTTASALALIFVTRSKNLFIASLWPTIFCVLIGLEIFIMAGEPYAPVKFFTYCATVMFGEFITVTCVGYPLVKYLMKHTTLVDLLKSI